MLSEGRVLGYLLGLWLAFTRTCFSQQACLKPPSGVVYRNSQIISPTRIESRFPPDKLPLDFKAPFRLSGYFVWAADVLDLPGNHVVVDSGDKYMVLFSISSDSVKQIVVALGLDSSTKVTTLVCLLRSDPNIEQYKLYQFSDIPAQKTQLAGFFSFFHDPSLTSLLTVFFDSTDVLNLDLTAAFGEIDTVGYIYPLSVSTMQLGILVSSTRFVGRVANWLWDTQAYVGSDTIIRNGFDPLIETRAFAHLNLIESHSIWRLTTDMIPYHPRLYDRSRQGAPTVFTTLMIPNLAVSKDKTAYSKSFESDTAIFGLRDRRKGITLPTTNFLDGFKIDQGFLEDTLSIQGEIENFVWDNTMIAAFCSKISQFETSAPELLLFPIYELHLDGTTFGLYYKLTSCQAAVSKTTQYVMRLTDTATGVLKQTLQVSGVIDHIPELHQRFLFLLHVQKTYLSPQVRARAQVYFATIKVPEYQNTPEMEVFFEFATTSQHTVSHGLGNTRLLDVPQDFVSVFLFRYHTVQIVQGAGLFDHDTPYYSRSCQLSRNSQDSYRFTAGTYDTMVPGDSNVVLGCVTSEPGLTPWGCNPTDLTSAVPNCDVGYKYGPAPACSRCTDGFVLVQQYSTGADSCSMTIAGCALAYMTSSNTPACSACKFGWYYDPMNAVCQQYTTSMSKIYSPHLQSQFNGATVIPHSTPAEQTSGSGVFVTYAQFDIKDASSVLVEISLEYSAVKDTEAVRQTVDLILDGDIDSAHELLFEQQGTSFTNSQYVKTVYGIIHNLASNSILKIGILFRRPEVIVQTVKVLQLKYIPDSSCQVQDGFGVCMVCNWEAGYYLTDTSRILACSAIPQGKYPVIQIPGSAELLSDCATTCLTCLYSATNCTSCPLGYTRNPVISASGSNLKPTFTCIQCHEDCASCSGPGSTECLSCAAGKSISTQNCSLSTFAQTHCCYSCSLPGCTACSYHQVCSNCSAPLVLSPNFTCVQPEEPAILPSATQSEVRLSARWDNSKSEYILQFSESASFSKILSESSLTYNAGLMQISFGCPTSSNVGDRCISKVVIRENIEIQNQDIVLTIPRAISGGNVRVNDQQVYVQPKISYYVASRAAVESLGTSSEVASQITTATTAVSLVSTGSGFTQLIKLTQCLELVLYMNIQFPVNFQVFLQNFASNLFSVTYNPFDGIDHPDCRVDWTFEQNDQTCLFLQNSGSSIFLLAVGAGLKVLLFGISKLRRKLSEGTSWLHNINNFFGADFLVMIIDSMLFELVLASVLNITTPQRNKGVYATINLVVSYLVVIFYGFEMVFVWHYMKTATLSMQAESGIKVMRMAVANSSESEKGHHNEQNFSKTQGGPSTLSSWYSGMSLQYLTLNSHPANWTGRYRVILQQLKGYFSAFIVVGLFDYPRLQVCFLAGLQASAAVLFVWRRPHNIAWENAKLLISETGLALCMLLSVTLVDEFGIFTSEKSKYLYAGYPLITVTAGLFLAAVIASIYEAILTALFLVKKLRASFQNNLQTQIAPAETVSTPTKQLPDPERAAFAKPISSSALEAKRNRLLMMSSTKQKPLVTLIPRKPQQTGF